MTLKLMDTVYKLKNAKEGSKFAEVTISAITSTFVVVKSQTCEEEATVKKTDFETSYEEKGFEDLTDQEKISHFYKQSTYALTALSELSRTLTDSVRNNPNLAILNNTLHELVLLSSPVTTPSVEAYREGLKGQDSEPEETIQFLDIEQEVA